MDPASTLSLIESSVSRLPPMIQWRAMERRAQAAESLVARSSGQAALDYAIQAADLYMRAAAEATTRQDAARLRRKCQQLITQAERLKAVVRAAVSPAQRLLERTSRLHGNNFPPWKSAPLEDEFHLLPGQPPFTDDAALTLSVKQAATFGGWKTPRDLFDVKSEARESSFMDSRQGCDLVQDLTTDCSVVASLCAGMRILTGRQAVLSSIFYPFDRNTGLPKISESGKYVLRFYFNGCFRRVVIDERLPASVSDRTLFVVDRRNPSLIWPALLEKAYLKVRGGYDFPGSNSGTDLWVLTGWVPEQLFLQREDLDINATWNRVKDAHDLDDVVITLGTGRISTEEEEVLGLIGEHDYAVLDLEDIGGTRRLLVKNPWSNGSIWKGEGSPHADGQALDHSLRHKGVDNSQGLPLSAGSFWMSLDDVVQHFESMYLNWNPKRFAHRQDHHLAWPIPPPLFTSSLARNPQWSLHCVTGGSVWILASRHFLDAELDIARTRTESLAAVSRQFGFMSILIFDNEGHRVQIGDGEIYRGPYVDSPQTLARLEAEPNRRYTVVLDEHEFPLPEYTLTLSVFSQEPVQVKEAEDSMPCAREVTGSWNRRTAGGNASCPTYFINPQYKLAISQSGPISILLSTDIPDVHVHIDLVWGDGKRVHRVKVRDLVGSSGEYRRGCAIADIPRIDAGIYTVVCSTFDAGQMASFNLRVMSMAPVTLDPVASDAAGKLRTPLPVFSIVDGEELRRAPLAVSWLTRASVNVRTAVHLGMEGLSRPKSNLTIRLSVIHGWAPERDVISVSGDGEFQEPMGVVRTPEFDIEPERIQLRGMWLVLESMGTPNAAEGIEIELHSDAPVHVGAWEVM